MQLELLIRDEQALKREIERRCGMPIEVVVTDNSSSLMSYRPGRRGAPAKLRIHRMFLGAEPPVMDALGRWLSGKRDGESPRIIDGFIERHRHLIRDREARPVRVETLGTYFDLNALFDEMNAKWFEGRIAAQITWGRMPKGARRRSIRLGSFTPQDNMIRIHPLLDQEFVPEYVIRYIVFHEMLHAKLGIGQHPSGRRCIHSRDFKLIEQAYPDYARAVAWHDNPKNLGRLLRASPKPC